MALLGFTLPPDSGEKLSLGELQLRSKLNVKFSFRFSVASCSANKLLCHHKVLKINLSSQPPQSASLAKYFKLKCNLITAFWWSSQHRRLLAVFGVNSVAKVTIWVWSDTACSCENSFFTISLPSSSFFIHHTAVYIGVIKYAWILIFPQKRCLTSPSAVQPFIHGWVSLKKVIHCIGWDSLKTWLSALWKKYFLLHGKSIFSSEIARNHKFSPESSNIKERRQTKWILFPIKERLKVQTFSSSAQFKSSRSTCQAIKLSREAFWL